MTRIRRGNYLFITWKSDHPPRHVHVFKDDRLIVKWNLEESVAMEGRATRRILRLIRELEQDGLI